MSDPCTHLPRALAIALLISAALTPSLDAAGTPESSPPTLTAEYAETTIRAIYDRFSQQTRDSGNEVIVSLSGFQTLWPEEFDDHYWVDVITMPGGWTLRAGLHQFVENEAGVESIVGMRLEPRWFQQPDWLETQPEWVRNATIADAKALPREGVAKLPPTEALTIFDVQLRFEGRIRNYRAAADWFGTEAAARTAIVHDHVIPDLMLAVGEGLEILTEHPLLAEASSVGSTSNAADCVALDTTFDINDPPQLPIGSTTGHLSGRHEAQAFHEFRCQCGTDCVSRCTPTQKLPPICQDFGLLWGVGTCHRPYLKVQSAPGLTAGQGASCAAAMACHMENCPGLCSCGGLTISISGGVAGLEVTVQGQSMWGFESTPNVTCPDCVPVINPPSPGEPDIPCHDPVPQLQVEPVAGKALPGADSLFSNFPLERYELLEGRHYLMEEWAILVVDRDSAGSLVSVEVPAASSSAYAAHQRQSLVDNFTSNGGIASPPAARGTERSVLLVVHHPDHPHNERWIPTPQVRLTAAALSGDAAEGRAVVRADFSENRELRALDILYSDRPLTPEEQTHLESHLSLVYANDDRHRVVLYAVVELGGGTIGLESLMPLPSMCCCPSNWPNCNSGP